MEKKDWKKELRELSFMKGYYFKLDDNGLVKKKDDQLVFNREELEHFIEKELDKAREEGRKLAIHEISKTPDIERTRWRSDEDGEFDVLRIGSRYFKSKDADDYYSSIEAIGEEDLKDYESI